MGLDQAQVDGMLGTTVQLLVDLVFETRQTPRPKILSATNVYPSGLVLYGRQNQVPREQVYTSFYPTAEAFAASVSEGVFWLPAGTEVRVTKIKGCRRTMQYRAGDISWWPVSGEEGHAAALKSI